MTWRYTRLEQAREEAMTPMSPTAAADELVAEKRDTETRDESN